MKEFYIIYKDLEEDISYKYVIIKAENMLEACKIFVSDFPNNICYVIYDREVYPYLKRSDYEEE